MCVILHFVFFQILDGKDVIAAPAKLRQSHVSTISLLLVTAFRAAITSTLGIGFTQYLWHILRIKALRVGLIEELFQIRFNFLRLFNLRVIQHAPFLFFTAILSWLVPLATIYPPSALTVQLEARWELSTVDAAVVNPAPGQAGFNTTSPGLAYEMSNGLFDYDENAPPGVFLK